MEERAAAGRGIGGLILAAALASCAGAAERERPALRGAAQAAPHPAVRRAAHVEPPRPARRVDPAPGADPAGGAVPSEGPPPVGDDTPLGRRLAEASTRLRAGSAPVSPMGVGLLSGGAVQDVFVSVSGGSCAAVVAVGEDVRRAIDLVASDEEGRVLALEAPRGPSAVVRFCPDRARTVRVRVHLEEGHGWFAFQIFADQPGFLVSPSTPSVLRHETPADTGAARGTVAEPR